MDGEVFLSLLAAVFIGLPLLLLLSADQEFDD